MNVKHIILSDFLFDLTDCLKERKALNIADSTADFSDNNISIVSLRDVINTLLDFVGDMWNDLYSASKIVTSAFLVQNVPVHLACCNIGHL